MKDDRQIEEMLREHWNPEPPPGMRERVLRRAAVAVPQAAPRRAFRWQLAFAGTGLVVALVTAVSDHLRHDRLNTLAGLPHGVPPTIAAESLRELAQERDRLLSWLAAPASAEPVGQEGAR